MSASAWARQLAIAVGALALSAPRNAPASPSYPGIVAQTLSMPCAPPCTICHADLNGGIGTATRPFGVALKAAGLQAESPSELTSLLAQFEMNGNDSDGDGTGDVIELRAGQDPSRVGGESLCGGDQLEYGCSLRPKLPGKTRSGADLISFALLGLLALVVLRWRRRLPWRGSSDRVR